MKIQEVTSDPGMFKECAKIEQLTGAMGNE